MKSLNGHRGREKKNAPIAPDRSLLRDVLEDDRSVTGAVSTARRLTDVQHQQARGTPSSATRRLSVESLGRARVVLAGRCQRGLAPPRLWRARRIPSQLAPSSLVPLTSTAGRLVRRSSRRGPLTEEIEAHYGASINTA
ncbi:hypothetical protein HPB48_015238 [Haemaphysalis longicornis]|uniref:Uncharacterized protein n=1 Tax=Haemaphysalis longicornis TaxID=44386 RepID=A0A9J6FIZ9_HAELO|nr:hypothetical protein HPB48_015238 [Haemaphysalis longicornis]